MWSKWKLCQRLWLWLSHCSSCITWSGWGGGGVKIDVTVRLVYLEACPIVAWSNRGLLYSGSKVAEPLLSCVWYTYKNIQTIYTKSEFNILFSSGVLMFSPQTNKMVDKRLIKLNLTILFEIFSFVLMKIIRKWIVSPSSYEHSIFYFKYLHYSNNI